MFITLPIGLPLKPPIRNWKGSLETFSRPLDLNCMAFIEWLGTFVASLKSWEVLAYSPPRNKDWLFVPNGLSVPSLEMKPGKFLFDIVSPLAFLSTGRLGKGLGSTLCPSCVNQFTFKALLLSRASGKPGKLSSLGYVGLAMNSAMDSLSTSRIFGGLLCLPPRVFL